MSDVPTRESFLLGESLRARRNAIYLARLANARPATAILSTFAAGELLSSMQFMKLARSGEVRSVPSPERGGSLGQPTLRFDFEGPS